MFPALLPAAIQIDYFPYGRLIGPFVSLLLLYIGASVIFVNSRYKEERLSLPASLLFVIPIFIIGAYNSLAWLNPVVGSAKIFLCFSLFYLSRYCLLEGPAHKPAYSLIILIPVTLIIMDIFYRFSLTSYDEIIRNFRVFKIASMMFFDSNAAAMYIVCWIAVAISLLRFNNSCLSVESLAGLHQESLQRTKNVLKVSLLAMLVALLLTLSRSAIAAFFISYAVYLTSSTRRTRSRVAGWIVLGCVIAASLSTISYVARIDGSVVTKLNIYRELGRYLSDPATPVLNILFGSGMVDGIYKISYAPGLHSHTLFSTLIGQIGLIGTMFYVLWFIVEGARSGKVFLLISAFILVSGFAYTNPFYETFFLALGIASAFSRMEKFYS